MFVRPVAVAPPWNALSRDILKETYLPSVPPGSHWLLQRDVEARRRAHLQQQLLHAEATIQALRSPLLLQPRAGAGAGAEGDPSFGLGEEQGTAVGTGTGLPAKGGLVVGQEQGAEAEWPPPDEEAAPQPPPWSSGSNRGGQEL